jgi:serine/threonine protein kinase
MCRDLKPENAMMGADGYLALIDMGFAKQVPYCEMDASGGTALHEMTYTLCGTPDYIAPETLLRSGTLYTPPHTLLLIHSSAQGTTKPLTIGRLAA